MKKVLISYFVFLLCFLNAEAFAKHSCNSNCNHHGKYNHYNHNYSGHSSGSSNPAYIIRTEKTDSKQNFPDCKKHYVTTETITDYYSDGSKRIRTNSTIYNQDGEVLVSNCNNVNHILNNNNHYFTLCKNSGGCSIINDKGETLTKKSYSRLDKLSSSRFLVKYDKKYGIIDLNEKEIVPIKYQKFEKVSENVFITKLNGYYGILDVNNNILVKNDCEKIKQLQDVILLKRYNKYGLADTNGKTIYKPNYDKIKKLGEYILLKKKDNYQVLDSKGNKLNNSKYKKVTLKRNTLYGYRDKEWVVIE